MVLMIVSHGFRGGDIMFMCLQDCQLFTKGQGGLHPTRVIDRVYLTKYSSSFFLARPM
jgi:hypothetical protein